VIVTGRRQAELDAGRLRDRGGRDRHPGRLVEARRP
jgi:hypothetical protein